MAAESVVMPLAPASSVRTAEAISSPPRALVARSVLSGLAIARNQGFRCRGKAIARKPAGNDRPPARRGFTIFVPARLTNAGSSAVGWAKAPWQPAGSLDARAWRRA